MAYEGNRTAPAHMNGGNAGRTQNKKKKSKKGVIIAVAAVVVVIAAAAAVFGVMKWRERQEQEAYEAQVSAVLDVDTFYHGVVVNGIDLGGMTMDEAREALTTEEQNAEQIYTRTEKVELWKKPFSNRSTIACLSEMAAMAFARELLGLSVSPYMLDVLLLYAYSREQAWALYEELRILGGLKEGGT